MTTTVDMVQPLPPASAWSRLRGGSRRVLMAAMAVLWVAIAASWVQSYSSRNTFAMRLGERRMVAVQTYAGRICLESYATDRSAPPLVLAVAPPGMPANNGTPYINFRGGADGSWIGLNGVLPNRSMLRRTPVGFKAMSRGFHLLYESHRPGVLPAARTWVSLQAPHWFLALLLFVIFVWLARHGLRGILADKWPWHPGSASDGLVAGKPVPQQTQGQGFGVLLPAEERIRVVMTDDPGGTKPASQAPPAADALSFLRVEVREHAEQPAE